MFGLLQVGSFEPHLEKKLLFFIINYNFIILDDGGLDSVKTDGFALQVCNYLKLGAYFYFR